MSLIAEPVEDVIIDANGDSRLLRSRLDYRPTLTAAEIVFIFHRPTSSHWVRSAFWADWVGNELLEDVPHRQVVLTIPKRLRPYFRYERALLGDLAACAWRALRLWVLAYFEDKAAVPGAVGFIQTAGELLNFHPHVHLLVSDGVFDREGSFERFTYFDTYLIERLFRAEVLRLMRGKGLISRDIVDNLLSWRHSGFSVHADVRVPDRDAAARLGRYMIRCPIALSWAALIKRVYEIDPLLCPYCGTEMKIIVFITEHATVAHILEHVRMPAQRPEPLLRHRRSCPLVLATPDGQDPRKAIYYP